MIRSLDSFDEMISLDNLFNCWDQFKRGKRKRKDIQTFERHLEDNIFALYEDLKEEIYQHGSYQKFCVFDPKKRDISKAGVRDRLVHQMVYTMLVNVFDSSFIFHSYSCRIGKGTHQGVLYLERFIRKVSASGTESCYALKMDIKRFFDHVDHRVLKELIGNEIRDMKTLRIIEQIIDSFRRGKRAVGIPLGKVTSQVFANIYLHETRRFYLNAPQNPAIYYWDVRRKK